MKLVRPVLCLPISSAVTLLHILQSPTGLQHNDASDTAAQNIKFNNIITEVAMFHFY